MQQSVIKPCPVCGCSANAITTVLGWFVECSKSGHIHNTGTFGGSLAATKEAAIEDWNRRNEA